MQRLEDDAGRWRDVGMAIGSSRHVPPPPIEVPRYIDELCDYVNERWRDRSALHLAAYVMWRLNWIHPFVDGNGRTTRALSYYVLCSKLGFHIPGVTTVPELVAENKAPYYKALEAADRASETGDIDVSQMERLLGDLLAKQMVEALERASSPYGRNMDNLAVVAEAPMRPPETAGAEAGRVFGQTRSSVRRLDAAVFHGTYSPQRTGQIATIRRALSHCHRASFVRWSFSRLLGWQCECERKHTDPGCQTTSVTLCFRRGSRCPDCTPRPW